MRPLVAEYIETLTPYVTGKPIEETEREYGVTGAIKLASNENPLGPSPLALEAIDRASRKLHLYPDGASHYLIRKLATFLDVAPESIVVGCGSNEIIELVVRTFMVKDDEAVISQSSFLMYKVSLHAHGRRFVEVPMKPGLGYDLPAMARAIGPRTRVVFLANPDNPTGTACSRAEIEAFLEQVPGDVLVVLDEAYFEYVTWADYPNGIDYVRKMPNVMVMRTFSKIYGLAGLRLGYGIMSPERAKYVHRTRMPFNISALAQAAGIAALDDEEHARRSRDLTTAGIPYLQEELGKLGAKVPPSHANFVFADLGRPAQPIYEALLRRGIITRPVSNYGFPNALRISVGLPAHNQKLVAALRELLG